MKYPTCPHCRKVIINGNPKQVKHHFTTCKTFHHHVNHLENGTKKCALCDKTYKTIKSLYSHMSTVHFTHFSRSEKCHTCTEFFNPNSKHLELCAKYGPNMKKLYRKWRCLLCDYQTKTQHGRHGMFLHQINYHRGEGEESVENDHEQDHDEQTAKQATPERTLDSILTSKPSTRSSTDIEIIEEVRVEPLIHKLIHLGHLLNPKMNNNL